MVLPISLSVKSRGLAMACKALCDLDPRQVANVSYHSRACTFCSSCSVLLELRQGLYIVFLKGHCVASSPTSSRSLCLIVALLGTFPNQLIKNSKPTQYSIPCFPHPALFFSIAFICHINVFIYCRLIPLPHRN